ncbi:alpha beta-hydrolase [Fusarium albosuccineum]|uniref:Carboxylic ester hydrolase n=1 Tax=Fusarium albosuccineum TaxID=1237068 RepID=A0A8H4LQB5_9HYPO|nr:alpha beta-hydrolase [Fusarium albosuccineum]
MRSLTVVALVLFQWLPGSLGVPFYESPSTQPSVAVKNGSYQGVHSEQYDQDFFLGIPYAQPPVGDLRFRNPRSLKTSWSGNHHADKYSPACVGYGPSQLGYNTSEDCLYLNVIRPSRYAKQKLPVAVWIHGGGYVQGSGVDLRYNLSFIVEQSVKIGHPIVAVGINYRLSAWGFLNSAEAFKSGDSNMGLRDQRLSLQWVHENIAAFGGDPSKVTIWGQSAGGASVGAQILAYNGRDDGLFRSAIMQSGTALALGSQTILAEDSYKLLLKNTGCSSVDCLRTLPFKTLNGVLNTTALSGGWTPKIDGDFIARHSSQQLADGDFVKVPIIVGANTDEGTSFSPKGINTTAEFKKAIEGSSPPINNSFAEKILKAYPQSSREQILPNLAANWVPPPAYGKQYRRTATYYGDIMMIASRRLAAETWARLGLPVYSYRFDAIPAWATYLDGATHFVEVAFAMLNLKGTGYAPVRTPPFEGLPESYRDLARLMASDWIKFVATGDPNGWKGREKAMKSLGKPVPAWPRYKTTKGHGAPKNFLYQGNLTSTVEHDTWRSEAIELLNSASLEVYDR